MLSIFGVSLVLYFIKILSGSRNLAMLIEKWISFSKLVPVLFRAFRSPGVEYLVIFRLYSHILSDKSQEIHITRPEQKNTQSLVWDKWYTENRRWV